MAKFTVGNPGKPLGATNKSTAKIKNAIASFLEGNIDSIQDSFDKLKPIEKLQFIANILPYAVPKLSSVQSENQTNLNGEINIRWSEPRLRDSGNKGSNGELLGIQAGVSDNSESGWNEVGEDLHD